MLVITHEARLRAFLANVVGGTLADDVAQEAFVKAWLGLAQYRGEANFRTWLTSIAWRLGLDHLRRSGRDQARDTVWQELGEATVTSSGTARIELQRALASLTASERAALVLTEGHGWSQSEAAAILGVPLGTLKSTAARAKAKARAAIEGSGE